MKRKQGLSIIILAIVIFLSSTTSSWANGSKINIQFKDTKPTDWYMPTVSKLVELKGIAGLPDGTFKPNLEIKKGEFIKILVGVLGFDEGISVKGHWAENYRRRAALIGLIDASEFTKLDETITRYEMSKVIVKAIEYKGESHIENRDKYISQINDYYNIPSEYKDYVLKSYIKGLISGYPDGEFKGNKGLSRAEASAVIMRVIDATERKMPAEPQVVAKTRELTEEDIKRLQGYEQSIKSRMGFEEFYNKEREEAEAYAEKDKYHPRNFGIYEDASEMEWITSSRAVYKNILGSKGVRGIIRVKYDKPNKEGLEIGKYYERDIEIHVYNTAEIIKEKRDGKIVDVWTGGYIAKMDAVEYLSPWKEVK